MGSYITRATENETLRECLRANLCSRVSFCVASCCGCCCYCCCWQREDVDDDDDEEEEEEEEYRQDVGSTKFDPELFLFLDEIQLRIVKHSCC